METTTHAISWVEIPVIDFERAKAFYSAIFDYEMPEMQMDQLRMGFLPYDQQNGGVGGAIVHGDDNKPTADGPKVYLNGGKDLDIVLNRVTAAGGTVLLSKTVITPEFGYFATFRDPEGNHISLHSMS